VYAPSRRLAQTIVAVAVAEDPACVDMVDGRLIGEPARRRPPPRAGLGRRDRRACDAATDPTEASPWRDWSGKSRPLLTEQRASARPQCVSPQLWPPEAHVRL